MVIIFDIIFLVNLYGGVMAEIVTKGGKIFIDESVYPLVLYGHNGIAARIFKAYEQYLVLALCKEGEETIVYWNEIKLINDPIIPYKADGIKQYINSVLLALRVLTLDREGAWSFTDDSLNPVFGTPSPDYYPKKRGSGFFVREKDIIDYGNTNHKDWTIFQMNGVRSR
jgi:hypothetical protein